jgi:hypothetical protein
LVTFTKKNSSNVWNHATQVIEYWTFFSMTIELNQNEKN